MEDDGQFRIDQAEFRIDQAEIKAEARYGGLWVLRTNTGHDAETAAHVYKMLWAAEQSFRTARSILESRPIYHQSDEAILRHVFCSLIALTLEAELERQGDGTHPPTAAGAECSAEALWRFSKFAWSGAYKFTLSKVASSNPVLIDSVHAAGRRLRQGRPVFALGSHDKRQAP